MTYNLQNNWLACIFCKFLKIKLINNEIATLYFHKFDCQSTAPAWKGKWEGPTSQTAWVSGLRLHSEGAIFSQRLPLAFTVKNECHQGSEATGACVHLGSISSWKASFLLCFFFLYIWLVCVKSYPVSKPLGGYLKKKRPLARSLDKMPFQGKRKWKQNKRCNPIHLRFFLTFFYCSGKYPLSMKLGEGLQGSWSRPVPLQLILTWQSLFRGQCPPHTKLFWVR